MLLCWLSRLLKCYAECCYAECRYAECHYAECRSAVLSVCRLCLVTQKVLYAECEGLVNIAKVAAPAYVTTIEI